MFDDLTDTNLWIALHHHNFGCTTYLFTAYTEPTIEQIIKTCEINYEPDIGEDLEWFQVPLDEKFIPHIET